MEKNKVKSNRINSVILSCLIFLQIVVPAFSFACNELISAAAENDQNHVTAETSCCAEKRLPAHKPAPQENEKHASTTPCSEDSCDICVLFCCNSTAYTLTSHIPKAHFALTSTIPFLFSVSYTSPYLHGIYRPPRA